MKTINKYGLKFHHLGLAVREPESAVRFLSGTGYRIGDAVRDDLQNVNLMFCTRRGMPAMEVIYPTEKPGPLQPILKTNVSLIYHVCYESRDLKRTLRALEADGNRVIEISPPQPAVLFGGRRVSFHVIAGFGVVEILESA